MQRPSAAAALCCALCLPWCHGLGSDATVLLQGSLARSAGEGAALELERAARVRGSLSLAVRFAVANSGLLSRLAFRGGGVPAQELAAASLGCSAEDKVKLDDIVDGLQASVMATINATANATAPAGAVSVPGFGTAVPMKMGDLPLPESCRRALQDQASLAACAQEALGVSAPCAGCVPKLFAEVKSNCQEQCEAVEQPEAAAKQDKSSAGAGADADAEEDLTARTASAMKRLLPCAECVQPKVTSFAKCIGEPEWGGELLGAIGGYMDALRVGVELTGR